jgi:ketosteroid isomerase-like protein
MAGRGGGEIWWGLVLLPGMVWAQAGRAKPSAAVPGPGPVEPQARVARPSAGVGVRDGTVERFLREFERASEANDANVKAALYADEVDRYFLRTHVTREFVYRDVLDWLSRGRLITRFRLTVLSEEGSGAERTLVVRKEASWIAGGERKDLVVRSQLVLRRMGEVWRIVGERDYKPG